MENRSAAASRWRALLPLALLLAPAASLYWLLVNPRQNLELLLPFEHLVVATNTSALALAVGGALIVAAMQRRQLRIVSLALGFFSMAALFVVHGLATPGVLMPGQLEDYGGASPHEASSQRLHSRHVAGRKEHRGHVPLASVTFAPVSQVRKPVM